MRAIERLAFIIAAFMLAQLGLATPIASVQPQPEAATTPERTVKVYVAIGLQKGVRPIAYPPACIQTVPLGPAYCRQLLDGTANPDVVPPNPRVIFLDTEGFSEADSYDVVALVRRRWPNAETMLYYEQCNGWPAHTLVVDATNDAKRDAKLSDLGDSGSRKVCKAARIVCPDSYLWEPGNEYLYTLRVAAWTKGSSHGARVVPAISLRYVLPDSGARKYTMHTDAQVLSQVSGAMDGGADGVTIWDWIQRDAGYDADKASRDIEAMLFRLYGGGASPPVPPPASDRTE